MSMTIEHFYHQPTATLSYVVADSESKEAAVIDPVLDFVAAAGRTSTDSVQKIIDYLQGNDLKLRWILETHAHADHLSGADLLKKELGGEIAIGKAITQVQEVFKTLFNIGDELVADGRDFDRLLADGDTLPLGNLQIRTLSTPGHTPACSCYQIEDAVFVGDTIFMPSFGTARCDFPGGDAGTLYDSIQKLLSLPPETRLFMCHDYPKKGESYRYLTSVQEEREQNIHLTLAPAAGQSPKQAYVEMRSGRDAGLGAPALILPALQYNIRAGKPPQPEDNGVAYLKLPLNQL